MGDVPNLARQVMAVGSSAVGMPKPSFLPPPKGPYKLEFSPFTGLGPFHSFLFPASNPLIAMATPVVPTPTCRAISARGIPSSRYK